MKRYTALYFGGTPVRTEPTVFVVDDDALVRQALMKLMQSVRLPVETFESAEDFLAAGVSGEAGCVVLDIRIPGMSGLELHQMLSKHGSLLPIIFLTGYSDVPTAVQTLKAGAFDFVEKPYESHRLLDTIHAALRKNQEARLVQMRKAEMDTRLATLTPGERSVLEQMLAGKGYKQIAKELDISYKTVQARRAQIMKKVGAEDFPGLIHMLLTARQLLAVA
ncbi:MAG: response regulator transcription factor [Planctomycetes bacterium]|nr:response regulator transcription factor [Planctomycetota bacterium]